MIGSRPSAAPSEPRETAPSVLDAGQAQQAIQQARELFHRASQPPRWPMYVRQLKQYLRGIDESFDERKLGFAGILEFLRACQREGVVRLERDRKGVLRVFPGANLPRQPSPVDTVILPVVGEVSVQPAVDQHEDQKPDMQVEFQPSGLATTAATSDTEAASMPMADITPEAPDQPDASASEQEMAARPTRARRARKSAGSSRSPVRRSRGAKPAVSRKRPEPV